MKCQRALAPKGPRTASAAQSASKPAAPDAKKTGQGTVRDKNRLAA
jgi:hypothetical protein